MSTSQTAPFFPYILQDQTSGQPDQNGVPGRSAGDWVWMNAFEVTQTAPAGGVAHTDRTSVLNIGR